MPKKQKKTNVQRATEKKNPGSEPYPVGKSPAQAHYGSEPEQTEGIIEGTDENPVPTDMIRKDLQPQPEPEKPLTLEALAAQQAKFQQDLVSDLNELVKRVAPAIQFADQLEQAKQQQQQNPNQQQPAIGGGLLEKVLLQTLAGGGGGDDKFKEMVYDSFAKQISFSQKFQDIFLAKFAGSTISEMTSKVATGQ